MTEAQLLAALEAEDFAMALAILDPKPVWFTNDNALVAHAFLRANWRLHARVLAESTEFELTVHTVRAQQAAMDVQQAHLTALLAELDTRKKALDATTAARETAEDDLDIFQAGYERGYAIGWDHAQQEKTS
jgi:hypothetical protein